MIELRNINKTLNNKPILENTSVYFNKGKITSVIGPNGAGKSTLLAAASRLLEYDSGEIYIDGAPMKKFRTDELAKLLAVLTQTQNITMQFTVRELVAFGRFPYSKGRLTNEDELIIERAIEQLGLTELEYCYIDQLSGGQQRMAFIAMIVAQDTDYIFLDEPLASLDINHALQIMKHLRRLAHDYNKAIVIVIHDINFASCYSDYIIALKQGKIIADGTVDKVIQADTLKAIYETDFTVQELNGQRLCSYHY